MKKNILRLTTVMAVLAVMLVMLCAFAKADVFALEHEFIVKQGVATDCLWNADSSEGSDTVTYFKINPTKTGIINFQILDDSYSGYVVLCNSAKSVISKDDASGEWIWGGSSSAYLRKILFGVKKGKTYYIKIKGAPVYDYDTKTYHTIVKWTNGAVKASKSGKKKSKAVSLKRKKTYKGLIVAGDKSAKWYKVTTNKKNFKIYFKGKTNGTFKAVAYYKSYGRNYSLVSRQYRYNSSAGGFTFTNYSKKKQTIYIKVQRESKSSGSYTLKWK